MKPEDDYEIAKMAREERADEATTNLRSNPEGLRNLDGGRLMNWIEHKWDLEYELDKDSCYDSSWVVTTEADGKVYEGIGALSCGELVGVTDIEEVEDVD